VARGEIRHGKRRRGSGNMARMCDIDKDGVCGRWDGRSSALMMVACGEASTLACPNMSKHLLTSLNVGDWKKRRTRPNFWGSAGGPFILGLGPHWADGGPGGTSVML
jgi:hypothetical protein